jgi:hypothetical protein
MLAIESIEEILDQSLKAMDTIGNSRTRVVDVIGQGNQLIRATGAQRGQ